MFRFNDLFSQSFWQSCVMISVISICLYTGPRVDVHGYTDQVWPIHFVWRTSIYTVPIYYFIICSLSVCLTRTQSWLWMYITFIIGRSPVTSRNSNFISMESGNEQLDSIKHLKVNNGSTIKTKTKHKCMYCSVL
jgi:hypothetical protein